MDLDNVNIVELGGFLFIISSNRRIVIVLILEPLIL